MWWPAFLLLLAAFTPNLTGCVLDWDRPADRGDASGASDQHTPSLDSSLDSSDAQDRDASSGPPDAATDASTLDAMGAEMADLEAGAEAGALVDITCLVGTTTACAQDTSGAVIEGLSAASPGTCQLGQRTCQPDGRWGDCEGAVGPGLRQCDSDQDHDCDGYADNDATRRDAQCECWPDETKDCTGEPPNHCPGKVSCVDHRWASCSAPAACSCVNADSRACSAGPNNCPGGTQSCVNGIWQACAGAPNHCECSSGTSRSCSGGPNNCPGGTQTCTSGQWGACSGAPQYCECSGAATASCSSLGAGECGTATCLGTQRWNLTGCSGANLCGGCGSLAATPGSACDGSDADMCKDGAFQCVSGQVTCNDSSTSSSHVESCDSQDNDCDGTADNGAGMTCIMGSTSNCTYASGSCSAPGSRSCTSLCQWRSCEPFAETACNRMDDDCDGRPDEGLLTNATFRDLMNYDGELRTVDLAVSPVSSAGAGAYLAVYQTHQDTLGDIVWALRINASGAAVGAPIQIANNKVHDPRVEWSGTSWMVLYQRTGAGGVQHLRLSRVAPATGNVTDSGEVYVGHIQNLDFTGGSLPVAVWAEGGTYGGIKGATFGGTIKVTNILQNVVVADTSTQSYLKPTLALVNDGSKWAMWGTSWFYSEGGGASANRLLYVELDAALKVLRTTTLYESDYVNGGHQLEYSPTTKRVYGLYWDNGWGMFISHLVDGSGIRSINDSSSHFAVDTDGTYAFFNTSGFWNRFDANDDQIEFIFDEPYHYYGDDALGFTTTPGSATNRATIVGGVEGVIRVSFVGCK